MSVNPKALFSLDVIDLREPRFPLKVHATCLMAFVLTRLIPPAHQQIYGQRSASLRGNTNEGTRRVFNSIPRGHHLGARNSCGGVIVHANALLLHVAESLRDLRPDAAMLAPAGRGNIDGEPIQGTLAHFVAREVDLLRPRRIVLGHHDD